MSPCVAILAAAFNEAVVEPMITEAQEAIRRAGGVAFQTVRVPGAYELPLTAQFLFEKTDLDVLIVLGYIEKGETLHGEIMGHTVHRALLELQLQFKKPMGLGIIGPGATAEQAEGRKVPYARAAVEAAMGHLATLKDLRFIE